MRHHPYDRQQGPPAPNEGRSMNYKGRNYDPNYHAKKHGGNNNNRNNHQDDGHPYKNDDFPVRTNRYKGRNYDPEYQSRKYEPEQHNRKHHKHKPPREPSQQRYQSGDMNPGSAPPQPMHRKPRYRDQDYQPSAPTTDAQLWTRRMQQQQRQQQVWAQFRDGVLKMLAEDGEGDTYMCSCRSMGTSECYHAIMMQYQKRLTLFTHLQHDVARFIMFLASQGPDSPRAIYALAKEFVLENQGSPLQAIIETVFSGGSAAQLGAMGLGIDFLTDDVWGADGIY